MASPAGAIFHQYYSGGGREGTPRQLDLRMSSFGGTLLCPAARETSIVTIPAGGPPYTAFEVAMIGALLIMMTVMAGVGIPNCNHLSAGEHGCGGRN